MRGNAPGDPFQSMPSQNLLGVFYLCIEEPFCTLNGGHNPIFAKVTAISSQIMPYTGTLSTLNWYLSYQPWWLPDLGRPAPQDNCTGLWHWTNPSIQVPSTHQWQVEQQNDCTRIYWFFPLGLGRGHHEIVWRFLFLFPNSEINKKSFCYGSCTVADCWQICAAVFECGQKHNWL